MKNTRSVTVPALLKVTSAAVNIDQCCKVEVEQWRLSTLLNI